MFLNDAHNICDELAIFLTRTSLTGVSRKDAKTPTFRVGRKPRDFARDRETPLWMHRKDTHFPRRDDANPANSRDREDTLEACGKKARGAVRGSPKNRR